MSGVGKYVGEEQSWAPTQLEPEWKLGICSYCRFGKQAKSLSAPVAGPAPVVHCRAASRMVRPSP